MTYSFKLAEEKHILGSSSLDLLVWSNRRDLIAVSNTLGKIKTFLFLCNSVTSCSILKGKYSCGGYRGVRCGNL